MFLNDRDNVDIEKLEKYLREVIAKAEVIELEGVKIPLVKQKLFGGIKFNKADVDKRIAYLKR